MALFLPSSFPQMPLTPVVRLHSSKHGLILQRVRKYVVLNLEKFILVNCQHGKLFANLRIGQVLLGQLDRADARTTNCLGKVEQRRLLNHRMRRVSPAFFPALSTVWQLVGVVFKPLNLLFVGFKSVGDAARSEKEALKTNKHSPAINRLRLLRLLVHGLEAIDICILERGCDTFFYD